jgi:hypothetical protein
MEHSRIRLEGDREQGPDVVFEIAHARHDPVRRADVIDEVQVPESGYVDRRQKYVTCPLLAWVRVDVSAIVAIDTDTEVVGGT